MVGRSYRKEDGLRGFDELTTWIIAITYTNPGWYALFRMLSVTILSRNG